MAASQFERRCHDPCQIRPQFVAITHHMKNNLTIETEYPVLLIALTDGRIQVIFIPGMKENGENIKVVTKEFING
ncbi:MAG: hypothetical protein Sapg2KO_25520 [Saprospiraceae bacterium]